MRLIMSLKRFPIVIILAVLIGMAAAHGLSADSTESAEIEFDDSQFGESDRGPVMTEVAEAMGAVTFSFASDVSVWSYRNPGLSKAVLLQLPFIVIGAFVFKWLSIGSLICYTAYSEYKARR